MHDMADGLESRLADAAVRSIPPSLEDVFIAQLAEKETTRV